jgi:tRNA(His) 5'-end guanylyltransferase
MRRTPVIARIDGRAFHTFTKRLPRPTDVPFSDVMHDCMVFTMQQLVDNVQGCVLGYTQSDEISLLLRDWDTNETQAFFDYNVQKMTSLMGAIASNAFNFAYGEYQRPEKFSDMAQFDARIHNIPKEEVTNYFIWRQQDASRNSVQMLGHHHFSQKQMHGKNNSEVQDMLMLEKNINWNGIPTWMKRGTCTFPRQRADYDIPIFTQDRQYIEQRLIIAEVDE